MNDAPPDLKVRTKAFALRVIRMYSKLPKNNIVAQVLGKQVLRSGASVDANQREASRARSKAEFISKTGDGLKEIEETDYWLELLVDSGCVPSERMTELLDETSPSSSRLIKKPKLEGKTMSHRIPTLQPLAFSP